MPRLAAASRAGADGNKGGTAENSAPWGRSFCVPRGRRGARRDTERSKERDDALSLAGGGPPHGRVGTRQPRPHLPRGPGRPRDARLRLPQGQARRLLVPVGVGRGGRPAGPLLVHRHRALPRLPIAHRRRGPARLRPARRGAAGVGALPPDPQPQPAALPRRRRGLRGLRGRAPLRAAAARPPRPARPARGALPVRRHAARLRPLQAPDQGRGARPARRRRGAGLPRRRPPHRRGRRAAGRRRAARPRRPRRAARGRPSPALEHAARGLRLRHQADHRLHRRRRHHPVRLLAALLARDLRAPPSTSTARCAP